MGLNLDDTPLPNDWIDVHEMLRDIRKFMAEHPTHELLPADDPGVNYSPPKIARVGFTAWRNVTPEFAHENIKRMNRGEAPIEWDEQCRTWSITLPRLQSTWNPEEEPGLEDLWKTAASRHKLCLSLKG